jgi:hypothetical protein
MEDTCRGDTTLLVGVDMDDPCRQQYRQVIAAARPTDFRLQLAEHGGLRFVVAWINHLAVPQMDAYRAIGHFGDDNVPRTDGWDVRIMESLERNHFCFADDLYPGRVTGTLCCHIFMRASVVKALGYMGPPSITHMYVDPVWMAWGQATSIEFLRDVVLEHMHHSALKSRNDATYRASLDQTGPDLRAFNIYCQDPNGLNADVVRIRRDGVPFTREALDVFRTDLNIPH